MMYMTTLRNQIIEQHIEDNYPNAKIVKYTDADSGLRFYTADELQSLDGDWFPLCCYKDPARAATVYGGRDHVVHTYTEGETGAGKTTRFVMQSILALSSMKVKPSFLIVDIHGEIIENLYSHLKKNGYNIKILNCDDPQRSDTYNPFATMANDCLKKGEIGNDEVNRIRKIAEVIQPVCSKNDPIWEIGARSYTNGCILDKFEDLINGDIPAECLTLYNIIQNHYWLRDQFSSSYSSGGLRSIAHYKKKGSSALSIQKMMSVTDNADRTRSSYYGVIENRYDAFGQPSLYALSSGNTIDISDFIQNPTVIVVQSGNTSIGDDLISLLMNDIYSQVVKIGKATPSKRLPRNIHCFLDEFANCNIAEGPEFIKMLTTSRKFGMFWHMILQCDAQLERKFDSDIGRIIRANCTELFMGSHDYDTTVRFAKSCGQKTTEDLSSKVTPQMPSLVTVDLMTADKLSTTPEGYLYVKANRHPLLQTYIEAFYNCDEFRPVEDIDTIYPHNTFDYRTTLFTPDNLPPKIEPSQFAVLEYLKKGTKSYQQLLSAFQMYEMEDLLRDLAQRQLVDLLEEEQVRAHVDDKSYALFRQRAAHASDDVCDTYLICDEDEDDDDDDDEDDEKEYVYNRFRGCAQDMAEEISEWFDGAPTPNRSMYTDLLNHLERATDAKKAKAAIENLTIVPQALRDIVQECADQAYTGDAYEEFSRVEPVLRYEIVEEYISHHDFTQKEYWSARIADEYALLLSSNAFPESVMDAFKAALSGIQDNLTLAQILEIKALLNKRED